MTDQRGFFDVAHRLEELSAHGDPLERVSASVDFEVFRPTLEAVLNRSDRAKGGRPPMDLKVLILQSLYGLSDQQAEFQIKDRRHKLIRTWTVTSTAVTLRWKCPYAKIELLI